MRLIDAEHFDERMRLAGGSAEEEVDETFLDGVRTVLECLKTEPTVEPQEKYDELMKQYKHLRKYASDLETKLSVEPQQKMGEWIVNKELGGRIQCSACGAFAGLTEDDLKEGYPTADYCFKCGAKMKGDKHE